MSTCKIHLDRYIDSKCLERYGLNTGKCDLDNLDRRACFCVLWLFGSNWKMCYQLKYGLQSHMPTERMVQLDLWSSPSVVHPILITIDFWGHDTKRYNAMQSNGKANTSKMQPFFSDTQGNSANTMVFGMGFRYLGAVSSHVNHVDTLLRRDSQQDFLVILII